MNGEMMSSAFRISVFWIGYCYICLNFLSKVLGRVRGSGIIITFFCIKGIIINIVFAIFMDTVYQGTAWWEIFFRMFVVIFSVAVFWGCYVTFYGSLLKTGLAAMIVEIQYSLFFAIILFFLNVLEHRSNMMIYIAPFQPPDLLMPIGTILVFQMEIKFLKPWIPKIRRYEPKHRKFLWVILGSYIFWGCLSTIYGLTVPDVEMEALFLAPLLFNTAVLIILVYVTWKYRQGVLLKTQFLAAQKKMIRLHYETLCRQVAQMERDQKQIDRQMSDITSIAQEKMSGERLANYLQTLTGKYEQIQAGIYCKDWVVDAVLHYMAKRCRQQNISCNFHFQEYERGRISEEDMAQLIWQILAFAIRQRPEHLTLKAGSVKNYLILEVSGLEVGSMKKLRKQMLASIAKYNGETAIRKKENRVFVELQKD